MLLHDPSLSNVDPYLRATDPNECESKEDLNPVRQSEVKERFRGVPMAAGWFVLFGVIWGWIARWMLIPLSQRGPHDV